MRVWILGWTLMIMVSGFGPQAWAKDRMERARAIFSSTCSSCHTLDHTNRNRDLPRGEINLGGISHRMQDAQLHAWLKNPPKSVTVAQCDVHKLDPVQIELVFALMRAPQPAATAAPIVPAFAAGPPLPAPPPPEHLGQGDRR